MEFTFWVVWKEKDSKIQVSKRPCVRDNDK